MECSAEWMKLSTISHSSMKTPGPTSNKLTMHLKHSTTITSINMHDTYGLLYHICRRDEKLLDDWNEAQLEDTIDVGVAEKELAHILDEAIHGT